MGKRQHFVPQFILRKFSKDERTISLLLLDKGRVIDCAKIRGQCCSDHFYGAGGDVERALARLESAVAALFGNLSPERLTDLGVEDRSLIRTFVHFQRFRTLSAAEAIERLRIEIIKTMVPKLGVGISARDLEALDLHFEDLPMLALEECIRALPVIADLETKFLVAPGKHDFILADDPVVICNQFLEHPPVFGAFAAVNGLGLKGFQVFMPISPRICVACFDGTTYEYGSKNARICRLGARDVHLLNEYQAVNARSCVYFAPGFPEDQRSDLRTAFRRYREWRRLQVRETDLGKGADGIEKQLVSLSPPEFRLGKRLGFLRVVAQPSCDGYPLEHPPVRSPDLVDSAATWGRVLDAILEKRPPED